MLTIFSSALCYYTAELLSSHGRPSSIRLSVRVSIFDNPVSRKRLVVEHNEAKFGPHGYLLCVHEVLFNS